MSDVITKLRSYRKVLDERAPEVTLAEVTSPEVAPLPPRRSAWALLAAAVAVVLVVALVSLLNQGGETPPADSVVPTTVVDATPTTTPTPTTSPTGASTTTVGDDEIVLIMAQGFPLIPDPEFSWTDGPDEASGQTARLLLVGEATDPGVDENYRDFTVRFVAFENEQLASNSIEDMIQESTMPSLTLETFILPDLGDEAVATVEFRYGRGTASLALVAVRRGRFVAQVVSPIALDLNAETVDGLLDPDTVEDILNGFDAVDYPVVGESVERLARIAETADEAMQTVLSSDVQPLPAPPPETLTSYEMNVFVHKVSGPPAEVSSIVTSEGYGCMFVQSDEAQPGVAEVEGNAFGQVDWDQGWFPSTTDSPEFQSLKDFCQTWSPHLDQSYLGDLIRVQEGHVGIHQGRQTLSYWFTKDDLIEAGVLTASDNIEINDFRMIVDRAGPWLVSLSVGFEGDAEAVQRLVLLDIPDLETTHSFSIGVGYGAIDDGDETWADRLAAWIQPRS